MNTATQEQVTSSGTGQNEDIIHAKCSTCSPGDGPHVAICGEPYVSQGQYPKPRPPDNACPRCWEHKYCPRCFIWFIN